MAERKQIATNYLILRLMTRDDQSDLEKIIGGPEVMKAFDEPPFTEEQTNWWLQKNLKHQEEHGYGLFAVIEKATGEFFGNCGLEHMEVGGD
jgi:[ribosomal protein S5]-alanine N-acetyltransferase